LPVDPRGIFSSEASNSQTVGTLKELSTVRAELRSSSAVIVAVSHTTAAAT